MRAKFEKDQMKAYLLISAALHVVMAIAFIKCALKSNDHLVSGAQAFIASLMLSLAVCAIYLAIV